MNFKRGSEGFAPGLGRLGHTGAELSFHISAQTSAIGGCSLSAVTGAFADWIGPFPSTSAIVNEKVDPAPASDATQIAPPNSTMFLQTASPRPVPGMSRFASRVNGTNTRAWFSGAIPMPLSAILMIQSVPRRSALM
jgi:hypothetical protein